MPENSQKISLSLLMRRYWSRTAFTWFLVVADGLLFLMFPLAIGWSVDGLIRGDYSGLLSLAILCGLVLITGAGRRFYDTRVYSGIYQEISREFVERENRRGAPVSRTAARAGLFTELIEFLENSLPEIVNQAINFGGTLLVIAFIDLHIFLNCLIGAVFTLLVFSSSEKRIVALNKGLNDEQERQVEVIAENHASGIKAHFRRMMRWNIRLSDLETWNFAAAWAILATVLIASISASVDASGSDGGQTQYGEIIAVIMYVFGFIESVMVFPLFYQQLLRLGDISRRLSEA
ncbi:MAG: ABC transporter six-transmembrane domain-containing protein [bacterium]|nr:ABC transporter six-transmembrane domain-containing protein [bacterium]